MADQLGGVRLNPPPTRKWVKFEDWDEEALEYKTSARRHSGHDLSSSVSSDDSGSLGSAGEGGHNLSSSPAERKPKEIVFNSSFGGYRHNGDAAALRTMFKPPSRSSPTMSRGVLIPTFSPPTPSTSPLGSPPSTSSLIDSPPATSTPFGSPSGSLGSPAKLKYSALNELLEQENTSSEMSFDDAYAALESVRREGGAAYLGWSNHVLGTSYGWSETIKGECRPGSLELLSTRPARTSSPTTLSTPEMTVETQSTPEMTGLRTISWPRSPTRSFVRNFP